MFYRCRTYEVLYNAGSMRTRKKNALRAAGVRLSNSDPAKDAPVYKCNKGTQTDRPKSSATGNVDTSTPKTPLLQRRRSLSVGSSPVQSAVHVKKSGTSLFSGSPIREPVATATQDETIFRGKKYPRKLIEVCQEFARQEAEERKAHQRN